MKILLIIIGLIFSSMTSQKPKVWDVKYQITIPGKSPIRGTVQVEAPTHAKAKTLAIQSVRANIQVKTTNITQR